MFTETGQSQLLQVFKGCQEARKDSFSTSLPYYLLTGRKGCKFYTDGKAYVAVANHPHVNDKLIVFPELNGNGQLTVKVLNQLANKGKSVQLARYTAEDFQKLNEAIKEDRASVIASIKLVPEDILDWKYPSYILDTVKTASLKGGEYKELRRTFNRTHDSGVFEETPLNHPDAVKKMRSSILIWAGLMINAGKESGHDMTEFYDTLVKLITSYPTMFDGFILSHQGEPAGFTIWDRAEGVANALASLPRRSIRDMSNYQIITMCQRLAEQGIKYVNLGGSETPELDKFKLKFRPIDSLDLNSYEVQFSDLSHNGVTEVPLVSENGKFNLKLKPQ